MFVILPVYPHPLLYEGWGAQVALCKGEKGQGKAPAARARREAAERKRAGVGPREQ
jgi:hypothetical protein